jgi:beta-alanine--pyruvate transaminase
MAENTARQLEHDLPDLQAYWMPFTGNRYFKQHPRVISRADGMHCHPKIVEAIKSQAETLDYAMAFQLGHPTVFELANRLTDIAPYRAGGTGLRVLCQFRL